VCVCVCAQILKRMETNGRKHVPARGFGGCVLVRREAKIVDRRSGKNVSALTDIISYDNYVDTNTKKRQTEHIHAQKQNKKTRPARTKRDEKETYDL
jgi:hypothetical protein